MRLPGTRYQEHGWEQVRKLLGRCSLPALRGIGLERAGDPDHAEALLERYTGALAALLRAHDRTARAGAPGNSYGDSVAELALSLAFELQAQPAFWQAFLAAVATENARSGAFWNQPAFDGVLRKKVNDLYASLRDKVDADNYMVATGRACSPNKIYTYRMLDTAYRDIARLFAAWRHHPEQVAAILDRPLDGIPIEARQMKSIAGCKAEWIIRWSASLERFGGAPGPLHTRSKRFASLKNSPAKIALMLAEIGDYEELSSNLDRGDDWLGDAGEAALWLEDYWRVIGESVALEEHNAGSGADGDAGQSSDAATPDLVDLILGVADGEGLDGDEEADGDADEQADEAEQAALAAQADQPAGDDADDEGDDADRGDSDDVSTPDIEQLAAEQARAAALSLPPRYLELARAAQDAGSWTLRMLQNDTLAIRLSVYQKLLGAADDSYPDAWLDPASGELPTLAQLAALDGISMPTLRKRRNDAIARLQAANGKAVQ